MEKCVIFDMDGVIVDSEPIHQECERNMFRMFGITVSKEEHNTLVGTTDETIWSQLKATHRLSVSVSEAIKLKKTLYMHYLKNEARIAPIPHVSTLIAALNKNGFLLALASSSPMEQIQYILHKLRLTHYFKTIVSGEDVNKGKPDPEIFLKAASSIGVDPSSCVVIEDSFNGVSAAISAGMKCIGYRSPHSGNQDLSKAHAIVDSFEELSPASLTELLHD